LELFHIEKGTTDKLQLWLMLQYVNKSLFVLVIDVYICHCVPDDLNVYASFYVCAVLKWT